MELRHLEHFVAVAEERNVTRAAARLHLAQSGLSVSVRALERELGAELFVRTARGVDLTDAGRALLREARRTLDSAAAAREAVARVRDVVAGTLRVGTEQCMGAADPFGTLMEFGARHPSVDVHVEQAGSSLLLERLRQGRLDVAFVAGPGDSSGLRLRELAREPMVLLCAPEHRLAGAREEPVEPAALAEEVFVDLRPHWGSRQVADAAFDAAGVRRVIAMQLDDVHKLLEVVGRGPAVAVVPRSVADKDQARGLRWRALTTSLVWEVSVAWPAHSRPSAAVRALLESPRVGGDRRG
ncbi:LysR family transcriptional regulator [Streptomyces ficellus]|uniref:LysR family transcriptional regulator n=1 Tax=Streptomyces ficellus TaxID=1977088 RepID=A0A6I6F9Q6_9ACTN|nr:LysR family transcriptional regulator [Streptomyces ficellus]QGV76942.1 LysR family transcriptional regulator [Streptomyces ficellus]